MAANRLKLSVIRAHAGSCAPDNLNDSTKMSEMKNKKRVITTSKVTEKLQIGEITLPKETSEGQATPGCTNLWGHSKLHKHAERKFRVKK